jgi:hypothetical protein
MIFLHVVVAILALIVSVFSFVSPSKNKILINLVLITTTLISGVMLILVNQASIIRTCVSGIVFLAVTMYLTILAKNKIPIKVTTNNN